MTSIDHTILNIPKGQDISYQIATACECNKDYFSSHNYVNNTIQKTKTLLIKYSNKNSKEIIKLKKMRLHDF